jgi:hypothetical protein
VKIAYACFWNAFARDGVVAKMTTQAACWRQAGHEVEIFCVSPEGDEGSDQALEGQVFEYSGALRRPLATRRMYQAAARWGADVAYLRYDHFLPTPGHLFRAVPTIVELNAPASFSRRSRKLPVRLFSHINARVIGRGARGFVVVTYGLRRELERYGKPIAVVANGVDLASREPLPPPPPHDRVGFVFLAGARAPWHGLDKIIALAAAMPDCDFTLIGLEPDQLEAGYTANVEAHGRLPRAEYEPMLGRSDVAIGSMAMDRAGLDEASTLKVGEYLAYGLPVVLGYQETRFMGDDPWFLLRLPTTEDNVDTHVKEVRAFAERVRGTRVGREEIVEAVGAPAKETDRLEFIAEMLGRRVAHAGSA